MFSFEFELHCNINRWVFCFIDWYGVNKMLDLIVYMKAKVLKTISILILIEFYFHCPISCIYFINISFQWLVTAF